MADASKNSNLPALLLVGQAGAPDNPDSGKYKLYIGTDNLLRVIDDAGNVFVVGAGAGAMVVIDGGILATDDASLTITGIPNTYRALKLILQRLRNDNPATGTASFLLQFNGDTTAANYYYNGSAEGGAFSNGGSTASIAQLAGARDGMDPECYGNYEVTIWDYAADDAARHAHFFGSYLNVALSGASTLQNPVGTGLWLNETDAIDEITLIDSAGDNLKAGLKWVLYGMA